MRLRSVLAPAIVALTSTLCAPPVHGQAVELPVSLARETDIDVLGAHAIQARDDRDYDLAIALMLRAVDLEPEHPWAWRDLTWGYLGAGRYEEGEKAARRQLEIDRFQPEVYAALGQVLWPQGKKDEALAAYRIQLELSPLNFFTNRVIAYRLRDLGRVNESLEHFERAASIAPEDVGVLIALGESYLAASRNKEALVQFERAHELQQTVGTSIRIATALVDADAELDAALGYGRSALVGLAEALPRDVGSSGLPVLGHAHAFDAEGIWRTMAQVHAKRGEVEQADLFFQAATDLIPHSSTAEAFGPFLESAGRVDRAIAVYARMLRLDESNPEIRARLVALAGSDEAADASIAEVRLSTTVTFEIPNPDGVEGHALAWTLLDPSGAPAEVLWRSGDTELTQFLGILRTSRLPVRFPPAPLMLVQRSTTITCPQDSKVCRVDVANVLSGLLP